MNEAVATLKNLDSSVLACRQLKKIYSDGYSQVEVLQGIDLTVWPKQMIAILGHSGSGKSTLLHVLGGLEKPTHGIVSLHGQDIHQLSETARCRLRNHCLGFVYQFHHLLPEFTALENVGMPLLVRGAGAKYIMEQATRILELVGLGHRLHHYIGQLSGGERQRVAIARALVTNPTCLLADEPTGNLDSTNAQHILQLFLELQREYHTSIILVTHDMSIAQCIPQRFVMRDGKLLAWSTSD